MRRRRQARVVAFSQHGKPSQETTGAHEAHDEHWSDRNARSITEEKRSYKIQEKNRSQIVVFSSSYLSQRTFRRTDFDLLLFVCLTSHQREEVEDPIFKSFQRECDVLGSLAHPNCVAFYGFSFTPDWFLLVMELCTGDGCPHRHPHPHRHPLNPLPSPSL